MRIPSARLVFVRNLVIETMRTVGFSAQPMPDDVILFWPPKPHTQTVRIAITEPEAEHAIDLFELAQQKVEAAVRSASEAQAA